MSTEIVLALSFSVLLGYFIGSVNFAVIIARTQGVDIMQEGSKNPGATNVKRVLGNTLGNLVFAFDALKGATGTFLPFFILWVLDVNYVNPKLTFQAAFNNPNASYLFVLGFIGTIVGHCYSVFLKFKGGKGVASTIGGLLVIMPIPILVGAVIWLIVFQFTRYVSVASMALGLSLPISSLILMKFYPASGYNFAHITFAAVIALFNIWTHRANVSRLRKGTESRFGGTPK